MSVDIIYSTEAFLEKNQGQPGKQLQVSFASVEAAKAAPFPEGYVFAYIPIEAGYYVYSAKLGWEFHKMK